MPSIEVQSPPAAAHLDPIPEDLEATGAKQKSEDTGFIEILRAEGGGWPAVPAIEGLGSTSDTIALFVSIPDPANAAIQLP